MYKRDQQELQRMAELLLGQRQLGHPTPSDIERFDYHGITSLLGEVHKTSSLAPALVSRRSLMVANEEVRKMELSSLFQRLHESGLDQTLVFKGTALAYSVYPAPWLRPRTDTDLLIRKRDLEAVSAVFEALGYQCQLAISGDYVSYQHTFGKQLIGQATINIDLHWRINNRQCLAHAIKFDELFARASTIRPLGEHVKGPCLTDSLLIACLHRLGHHHTEERLAWLYDIHLLAQNLTPERWQQLATSAVSLKLSTLCLDGLQTSAAYLGTQIPDAALEILNTGDKRAEPSAKLLQRDLSAWGIFLSDIGSLPSWVDRLRFILEIAFPPRAYIREHMKTQSATWGYSKRALRGFRRLFAGQ